MASPNASFAARILLALTNFKSPLLRTIVPCAAAAVAVQAAAAGPSVLFRTERFFDISGSVTYIAVGALGLYLPSLRNRALAAARGVAADKLPTMPGLAELVKDAFSRAGTLGVRNWRQVVLTGMVMIWASRLGTYLFSRVVQQGHDSRFDRIRDKPVKFASVFLIQAIWVMLPLMPVLALNAVPASALAAAAPRVAVSDVIGISTWLLGFYFEALADLQKSRWQKAKARKEHDEAFLTSGLFGKCRYPNYFGEICMWTGIATTAAGILSRAPIQLALGLSGPVGLLTTMAVTYISPAFTAFLLLKVSGVPLSEPKYDKRYGDRKDYQEWRNNTPRIIPKLW